MKKYLLFLVFIFGFSKAQNQRFTYEYKFVSDSTKKENIEKEFMVLDVNPKGSKFYSYEKFRADSLVTIELERQKNSNSEIISIQNYYKGKIHYTVSKTYPNFETFYLIGMGMDTYKVSDERKAVWKILPVKEKIGEFNTQKAETELFGRKWTAWFATEIPIHDGPYKFHGLPGLIVKLTDKTNSHSFELKAVKKFFENDKPKPASPFVTSPEISINQKQYQKMYLELRNDPAKTLREMLSQGGEMKLIGQDGKELNPADEIRKREQKGKEDRAKDNNIIELDMLK
ncbi:MAG TPA: GLPGLI family protein [Kaistella sp.]|nr:GLPGLI family protein [Kaistella sp.]